VREILSNRKYISGGLRCCQVALCSAYERRYSARFLLFLNVSLYSCLLLLVTCGEEIITALIYI